MAKLSDLPRIVRQILESEVILEDAAKEIKASIPKRTRLGKGVKENLGSTHTLPELKTKTRNTRAGLKKRGLLTGPGATPAKSGVNRSGATLESLDVKVSKGQIDVELSPEQQKKYTQLLKIDGDYQFMRLSAAEFKRVLKRMTNRVNRILRRISITDL